VCARTCCFVGIVGVAAPGIDGGAHVPDRAIPNLPR
jgi:hypothetical protein